MLCNVLISIAVTMIDGTKTVEHFITDKQGAAEVQKVFPLREKELEMAGKIKNAKIIEVKDIPPQKCGEN